MGVEDRLAEVDAGVRSFERRLGLDRADPAGSLGAVRWLNMGEDDLNAAPTEQLGSAAVAVANLAFHLQNEAAKCSAEARRLFGAVKRVVSDAVARQGGSFYEERLLRAVRASPDASRLDLRAQEAQHRADRLAYLAKSAEFSARLLMDLYQARRRDRDRPRTLD